MSPTQMPGRLPSVLLSTLLLLAPPAEASREGSSLAIEHCIRSAADHHKVNAEVLWAIAWHESRMRVDAIGRNTNGTTDFGAFQINSVHLPELRQHGITETHLFDPCASAYIAAWHYARQVRKFGNTWAAVGAYHSITPARQMGYANTIASVLRNRGHLPHGALPFPGERR